jgi:hypothetical protein
MTSVRKGLRVVQWQAQTVAMLTSIIANFPSGRAKKTWTGRVLDWQREGKSDAFIIRELAKVISDSQEGW